MIKYYLFHSSIAVEHHIAIWQYTFDLPVLLLNYKVGYSKAVNGNSDIRSVWFPNTSSLCKLAYHSMFLCVFDHTKFNTL